MTNVATVKYKGQARWEEVRGYDDLNIQPNCFLFQWFDTQEAFIIPMDVVESISTMREGEQDEKVD